MSKLKQWLQRLTGPEIGYKVPPKYIAINLSYHYYVDAGRLNDYVLFESPEEFQTWLQDNIARVEQDGWILYQPTSPNPPQPPAEGGE